MEPLKTVYCLIDQLCKKIKFSSSDEQSDSSIIQQRIRKLAQTDEVVGHVLKNKLIVLQMFDKKLDRFVDIDEDEKIGDSSEILVVLINKESEVMQNVNNLVDGTSQQEYIVVEDVYLSNVHDANKSTGGRGPLVSVENIGEDGKRKVCNFVMNEVLILERPKSDLVEL